MVHLLSLLFLSSMNLNALNYFRCEKNSDCAKAYSGCGRYLSVHKRYRELYAAKAHEGDKVSHCLAPTKRDKEYKHKAFSRCVRKNCVLVLPEVSKDKLKTLKKK